MLLEEDLSFSRKYMSVPSAVSYGPEGWEWQAKFRWWFVIRARNVGWYYADMIVEDRILLELKSQARTKNDEAQMLNYLKASGLRVGMLINFVYPKAQIKRLIL